MWGQKATRVQGYISRWGSRGSTVSGVMYFTFDLMHNIHSFRGIEIWTRRGLIDHTLLYLARLMSSSPQIDRPPYSTF